MTDERLGWRIYVVTGHDFDIYAYTIVECRGEKEALDIIRQVITPGDCPLRAKLVSVKDEDLRPPPSPEET